MPEILDIAIIGGGAAGLATAIFAARHRPGLRIAILDGARKLGAKLLVSGGGRCNVTNVVVDPEHFFGGSPHIVKRVLNAFPAERAAQFFRDLGVKLHEEEHGKLFPDTNDAHTVLNALLAEAKRLDIALLTDHRVTKVRTKGDHFEIATQAAPLSASHLVLATGGRSLPKTGSDGTGYTLAESLGHTIVPTTPALAPLLLAPDFFHAKLSGLTHEVTLTVRAENAKPQTITGSLLWTHFGISGPVVLNVSRLWHRAKLENRHATVTADFLPGDTPESVEKKLIALAAAQPRTHLNNALSSLLPARLIDAVLTHIALRPNTQMSQFARDQRQSLTRALTALPLPITDSRGFNFAEVTAGGVPLTEIDSATMQSRKTPGLHLVGEILDVDGRIGGFNFQWAWSTAHIAGRALAANFATGRA